MRGIAAPLVERDGGRTGIEKNRAVSARTRLFLDVRQHDPPKSAPLVRLPDNEIVEVQEMPAHQGDDGAKARERHRCSIDERGMEFVSERLLLGKTLPQQGEIQMRAKFAHEVGDIGQFGCRDAPDLDRGIIGHVCHHLE